MKLRTALTLARAEEIALRVARFAAIPAMLLSLLIVAAALDILPALPHWLHAVILMGMAAWLGYAIRIAIVAELGSRSLSPAEKVEKASALLHRPIASQNDWPVTPNPLWALHRKRETERLNTTRLRALSSGRLPLRVTIGALALTAAVLLAVFYAGPRFPDRLDAALSPGILGADARRDISCEVWIKPPAYTGLPPMVLPADAQQVVDVPEDSVVQIHVAGGHARPHLVLDGARIKMRKQGDRDYALDYTLVDARRLKVTQGWRTLGSWKLNVVKLQPPVITWSDLVEAPHHRVAFAYKASDQYGLAKVTATIALSDVVKGKMLPKGTALDTPENAAVTEDVAVFPGHPKELEKKPTLDWSELAWAGFPVEVTLTATSIGGLASTTPPQEIVLPERRFKAPVSKAIMAERKKLTLDPAAERKLAAAKLAVLVSHPEMLNNDIGTFLALRSAVMRLWQDETLAEVPGVQAIMWDAAVHLEDGAKGERAKALASAAQALRDALQNGASQAEIDHLTRELKDAMNQYVAEMQREMQQRMARGEDVPMLSEEEAQSVLNMGDLSGMIDKMNNLAKRGSKQAAEDMLNQFEGMMENLRMAETVRPGSKQMQAWTTMKQLRDLAEKQQQLMDQTHRNAESGQAGDAGQQQALQRQLGHLKERLRQLGAPASPDLDQSASSMGSAANKLGASPGDALGDQQQALDELRRGIQAMADRMGKEQGAGKQGSHADKDRDPFGRGGMADDEKVKIPDEGDGQKSREVLEELRKRSGERFRPRDERDYIERLLREY